MGISDWRSGGSLLRNRQFQVLLAVFAGSALLACGIYFWAGGDDDLVDQLRSSDRAERLAAIDALAKDGSEEAMQAVAEVTSKLEWTFRF